MALLYGYSFPNTAGTYNNIYNVSRGVLQPIIFFFFESTFSL